MRSDFVSLVYVKNKNNQTTYVYESTAYWDKEKQQSRNTRVCIGKLVNNVLVPNKQYKMHQELEQLKHTKPAVATVTDFIRKFYGATYLLGQISKRYGIIEDLTRCFPETYKQILSLAYFLVLEENNPLSRFPRWAATHVHPDGTSQSSSTLFQTISGDAIQRFFMLQTARWDEQEYLSFDISSVSSYEEILNQIKYTEGKDQEVVAQINLTLLCGQRSHMPVCYRKLPNNIPDISPLKRMIKDLADLITGKVTLILDRDFYSTENVNDLYTNHYKFLMGTRISLPFIQQHLDPVRAILRKQAKEKTNHQLGCYSIMSEWQHERVKKRNGEVIKTDKRIYVHLYYNEKQSVDDRTAFEKRLELLEEELTSNKRIPSHEEQYEKYFHIRQTPGRRITLTIKQHSLDFKQKDFGYFSLISNDIKDPIEALDMYRSRALIEKSFDNLEERMSMRSASEASDRNLDGKLFIQFVAHMFVAAIDRTMKEKDLYRTHTMIDLLDTLDVIEQFQIPGQSPYMGEIPEEQKALYGHFGFAVPK